MPARKERLERNFLEGEESGGGRPPAPSRQLDWAAVSRARSLSKKISRCFRLRAETSQSRRRPRGTGRQSTSPTWRNRRGPRLRGVCPGSPSVPRIPARALEYAARSGSRGTLLVSGVLYGFAMSAKYSAFPFLAVFAAIATFRLAAGSLS